VITLAWRHELILARLATAAFEELHQQRIVCLASEQRRTILSALHQRCIRVQGKVTIRIARCVAIRAVCFKQGLHLLGIINRRRHAERRQEQGMTENERLHRV